LVGMPNFVVGAEGSNLAPEKPKDSRAWLGWDAEFCCLSKPRNDNRFGNTCLRVKLRALLVSTEELFQ